MGGMIKFVHSSAQPEGLDAEVLVFDDSKLFLNKAAACSQACHPPAEALDVPKGHVGIHLVALGDVEKYGFNRNGDGFPKEANIKYHDTFVKHGHLHNNHKNKPDDVKLGHVKWSAYNEDMGRVELFVHADESKCERELSGMRKRGEASFSMACRVPNDRCCRCNTLRKTASDPKQCDHVRHGLGKLAEDGAYNGVYNDEPKFFDISFVHRPADRIAWSIKYASDAPAPELDSYSLWVPDDVALDSGDALAKVALARQMAEFESAFGGMRGRTPGCQAEMLLDAMAKSAAYSGVADDTITRMRELDSDAALSALASRGIVLSPVEFCKLAFGVELAGSPVSPGQIKAACSGLMRRLCADGSILEVCASDKYRMGVMDRRACGMADMEKSAASHFDPEVSARAVMASVDGVNYDFAGEGGNSEVARAVAKEYATYKLAAALIVCGPPSRGEWRPAASLAIRDMVDKRQQE